MPVIKKVLVANRGEIALRIMRTCREMGIQTVAVYSDADRFSPHVLFADDSVCIGKSPSSESYLVTENILRAAKETNADAIHPGYGFLSENAQFARLCIKQNLTFIGPDPAAIETMGDKTRARELIRKAGVPYPPGTESDIKSITAAKQAAAKTGYPVLIKAAAGGGGKGMRVVESEEEMESSIKAARSEAKNAFGDDRVFIEKYLAEPRHIEFQVFADTHGSVIHLNERECSVQRRHQKVIEEAPSPVMTPQLRQKMSEAAIAVAKSCNYIGAGTVEFLVDKHLDFYFLEMNTRLQVEHPVTELITGLDLVRLQIEVAEGKTLPITQEQVPISGHAIECRVYAEDPANRFLPDTGRLHRHRLPSGPGVRVDAGIAEGDEISVHYDPMISKLCVHASNRELAIKRMLRALDEYDIAGVKTTIPFCTFTLNHTAFKTGLYNTHFVPDHFNPEQISDFDENKLAAVVSCLLTVTDSQNNSHSNKPASGPVQSNWWSKRKTGK